MVRINLLPVRVSKKKEAGRQQLVLFVLVAVLGVVANYVWSSSRASELAAREKKVAATKTEIQQLDRIIGEVKNIRDQQQQLKDKLGVLAQLKAGRSGPVKMLDEVASVTPKRLWLTKLEEKAGAVTFTGTASTIDDVSELMSALKGSRHFKNVELGKTAAKADSKDKGLRLVEFTVTANVVYATEPGAVTAAAAAKPAAATPAAGR